MALKHARNKIENFSNIRSCFDWKYHTNNRILIQLLSVYYPIYSQSKNLIAEDRKVNLIRDVDSLFPERIRKLFLLIDEIIETNKELLSSVHEKIEESGEPINFIYSLIDYATKIRPHSAEPLRSLQSILSRKYSCENTHLNNRKSKEISPQERELLMIFKEDDLDSEIGFNQKSKIKLDSSSEFSFTKESFSKQSYPQIMAYYGAILNNEYDLSDVE